MNNDNRTINLNAVNLLTEIQEDGFSSFGIYVQLLAHLALSPNGAMTRQGAHAALRTWNGPHFLEVESVIDRHFTYTDDDTFMSI
jgi:hypothetical protein